MKNSPKMRRTRKAPVPVVPTEEEADDARQNRIPVDAGRLLTFVRQRRHRAAILETLSGKALSLFTVAYGGTKPRMMIETEHGHAEPADEAIAVSISQELAGLAALELEKLQRVLQLDLQQITPTDCPILGDNGVEERGAHSEGKVPNA